MSTSIRAPLEVAALIGQVGQPPAGGDAAVHMHIVVAKTDSTAYAGHLGAAHVRPIVQMIISGEPLRKVMNAKAAFLLGRSAR